MSKVDTIFGAAPPSLPGPGNINSQNAHGLTTSDYHRHLSELRLRPPSQRAFLRKLLNRALLNNGAHTGFPRNKPRCTIPRKPLMNGPTPDGGVLSLAPPSEP
jgi:hypothetical protein